MRPFGLAFRADQSDESSCAEAEERRQNMPNYRTKDTATAPGWPVEKGCQNCGTTEGFIERIWTDDGTKPWLCEDCAEEVRRLEKLADELAAAPSCQERERILDTAETTAELVNRLRAHDMAQCAACASARASVAVSGEGANSASPRRAGKVA